MTSTTMGGGGTVGNHVETILSSAKLVNIWWKLRRLCNNCGNYIRITYQSSFYIIFSKRKHNEWLKIRHIVDFSAVLAARVLILLSLTKEIIKLIWLFTGNQFSIWYWHSDSRVFSFGKYRIFEKRKGKPRVIHKKDDPHVFYFDTDFTMLVFPRACQFVNDFSIRNG